MKEEHIELLRRIKERDNILVDRGEILNENKFYDFEFVCAEDSLSDALFENFLNLLCSKSNGVLKVNSITNHEGRLWFFQEHCNLMDYSSFSNQLKEVYDRVFFDFNPSKISKMDFYLKYLDDNKFVCFLNQEHLDKFKDNMKIFFKREIDVSVHNYDFFESKGYCYTIDYIVRVGTAKNIINFSDCIIYQGEAIR